MSGVDNGQRRADARASAGATADSFDGQPVVGRAAGGLPTALIVAGFVLSAVVLFFILNAGRTSDAASLTASSEPATAGHFVQPPPPPLDLAPPPPPAPVIVPVSPAVPLPMAPVPAPPASDALQHLHAPAVVVDLQSASGAPVNTPVSAPTTPLGSAKADDVMNPRPPILRQVSSLTGAPASALLATANSPADLGANEQFALRASTGLPAPAIATQMTGLSTIITQGATIPGVLETALNSDLPGYTRAVVSRDVRSFDAKRVLIPRGSRLIGQYRSAISLGQSRVFVIWTRVIRPDGVSIQIGSPGDDALGRGGLSGDVNTHFFARFGSSILLSVLNGGIAAIAGTPTTQISIGSPAAAAGAAATATIPSGSDIMPTIKVKQGAAINIFVARDLDFSAVKPVP